MIEKLSPWLFTVGLFVIWEAACRFFNIDKFILPAPSEAFAAMAQHWQALLKHSFVTLWTTMAGFAIVVAAIALVAPRFDVVAREPEPVNPSAALAPFIGSHVTRLPECAVAACVPR